MEIPREIEREWHEYNELKSSGLKKKANILLLSIVKTIENQGLVVFKDFLYELCEDGLSGDYTKKIQYPIFVHCILPLLVEGYKSSSVTELIYIVKANTHGFGGEIYKAIGDISNQEHLKAALQSEPSNRIVINLLAADYVEALYFGAHHLPDGLIVELEYANSLIYESSLFIEEYQDFLEVSITESHEYYVGLYQDYQVWKKDGVQCSFQEWCEINNKTYSWVKSYYYE